MSPDRSERIQSIFQHAIRRSGLERSHYLDDACGTDVDVRAEVEALIALHDEATRTSAVGREAAGRLHGASVFTPGQILDGKFRIESVLGEGGMGTVFRGVQLALERPVAVKVMRPELVETPGLLERLRREALAVARLRHPNVVGIYDFCISPEFGAYLVMELVEGVTLADAIGRDGSLSFVLAAEVLTQICAAVQAAHEVGVIHRDLKPQNILLEPPVHAPRVRVLDFGIAKMAKLNDAEQLSLDGSFIGTPLYMSPEQASGMPVDARSDVYALGCILYELLAGRPPFQGPSVAKILIEHTAKDPKPPSRYDSRVPPWLDEVVLRALAKSPDDRFQSAAALADALTSAKFEAVATTGPSHSRAAATSSDVSARTPAVPNNLPIPPTTFVGRETDVASVADALARNRLVTLTGPAGIGKTRLAIRATSELLNRTQGGTPEGRPDECWFVDLAPAVVASDVSRAIATTLGVRAESDAEAAAHVARYLGGGRYVLVLDNAEHVNTATGSLVGVLLAACPDLRVLVTSRATLRISGETVVPVGALDLPSSRGKDDEIVASGAVSLFVERARLVSAAFATTSENVRDVAEICRHLDGLPLAIELAAARSRVLTPHQILDRLRDRLRLLKSSGGTGRHESLRAAIDWSYEMLGESERALFERLCVFSGGFTIDAIEGVCSDEAVDAFEVLDLLASLVDKSLVSVVQSRREARYVLLESIREYALEKLTASGAVEELRRRHRDHFLALAEQASTKLRGGEGAEWGGRLRDDHDNLRAALAWSRDVDTDPLPLLRMGVFLHVYFYERGHLSEGRSWLDVALDRVGADGPAATRSLALTALGNFAHDQGDLIAARLYQERALVLNREIGDSAGVAAALHNIGNILVLIGEYANARANFVESHDLNLALGRQHNVALTLFTQSTVAVETADWAEGEHLLNVAEEMYASIDYTYGLSLVRTARAYMLMVSDRLDVLEPVLVEALTTSKAVENRHNVATVSAYRANVLRHQGKWDEAEVVGNEALAEFQSLGDKDCTSIMLFVLGRASRESGNREIACERLLASLAIRKQLSLQKGIAECFEEAAALSLSAGDAEMAARVLGAADAIRVRIGAPVQPIDVADRARTRDETRERVGGAEPFDRSIRHGSSLSSEDALVLARLVLDRVAMAERGRRASQTPTIRVDDP